MECDICYREHDARRLPFLCAVDARNRIYEPRMKHLQSLMQNESLQDEVNDDLTASQQPFRRANSRTSQPSSLALDATLAQQRLIEDKTDQILAAADALRADIKAARDEIRERKAALMQRRSDLKSVSTGLDERREKQQMGVQAASRKLKWKWKQTAEDLPEVRAFLCAEAASLYGLKHVPAVVGSGQPEYYIGKVPITDLTQMTSISPEVLSTSLAHIAHVLMITCNYLAIRLPAEITLPHRDYPRPTIFNLTGSYNHANIQFQNTAGISTASLDPKTSNAQHGPRPRPLFIDKPLLQLAKDDSVAYSFFLEAVALLAYDIAWLCGSQGVPIGEKGSFDDICCIGRNLFRLLSPRRQAPHGSTDASSQMKSSLDDQKVNGVATGGFGRFSHGSACDFTGGSPGADPAKSLKLLSPIKIVDQLKKSLVGEQPAGDWEVIGDDIPSMLDGDGSVPATNQRRTPGKAVTDKAKSSPRAGSNGWMRVKNR